MLPRKPVTGLPPPVSADAWRATSRTWPRRSRLGLGSGDGRAPVADRFGP